MERFEQFDMFVDPFTKSQRINPTSFHLVTYDDCSCFVVICLLAETMAANVFVTEIQITCSLILLLTSFFTVDWKFSVWLETLTCRLGHSGSLLPGCNL